MVGAAARQPPVRPRLKSFTVLTQFSGCNWTADVTDFTHFCWSKEWTNTCFFFRSASSCHPPHNCILMPSCLMTCSYRSSAIRLSGSPPACEVLIVYVWHDHHIAIVSQVVSRQTRQYSFMCECNHRPVLHIITFVYAMSSDTKWRTLVSEVGVGCYRC